MAEVCGQAEFQRLLSQFCNSSSCKPIYFIFQPVCISKRAFLNDYMQIITYVIFSFYDVFSSVPLKRVSVFLAVAIVQFIAVFLFYWICGLVTLVLKFSQSLAKPHHSFVKLMHFELLCHT